MNNLTVSLVVVIAALAGFYGGAKVEQGKIPATNATAGSVQSFGASGGGGTGSTAAGGGGGGGGGAGAGGTFGGGFGRGTAGQITAVNGSTLTLTDAQGQQVKVQLSDTTTITKTVQGSRSDLQQGLTVAVQGQRGSDGTLTATAISILPAGTSIGGGGGAPRGPSGSSGSSGSTGG